MRLTQQFLPKSEEDSLAKRDIRTFLTNKTAGRKENYLDTDADVWGKIAVISTSREMIIFVFLQVTVMFLVASMDVSSVREHLYSPVTSRETFAMV